MRTCARLSADGIPEIADGAHADLGQPQPDTEPKRPAQQRPPADALDRCLSERPEARAGKGRVLATFRRCSILVHARRSPRLSVGARTLQPIYPPPIYTPAADASSRMAAFERGDRTRRWLQSRVDGIDQPLGSRRARARPGRRAPRRGRRAARRACRRSRSCSRSPATPSGASRRSGCGSRSGHTGRAARARHDMDVAIRAPGPRPGGHDGARQGARPAAMSSGSPTARSSAPSRRPTSSGRAGRSATASGASIPGSTRAARRSTSPITPLPMETLAELFVHPAGLLPERPGDRRVLGRGHGTDRRPRVDRRRVPPPARGRARGRSAGLQRPGRLRPPGRPRHAPRRVRRQRGDPGRRGRPPRSPTPRSRRRPSTSSSPKGRRSSTRPDQSPGRAVRTRRPERRAALENPVRIPSSPRV